MDDAAVAADVQPPLAVTRCCTKCGQHKAPTDFYVKNKKTGLLKRECKKCFIAYEQGRHVAGISWGAKPENRDRKNQIQRDKYWEDADGAREEGRNAYRKRRLAARAKAKERYYENRKKEIARSSRWNRDNPDKVLAWKEANRPRTRAASKRHRINNPEAAKISRDARRARKIGAKCERVKQGYEARLMAWQQNQCPYCRVNLLSVTRHDDHVIPLAKGGQHSERNLQITCGPCNMRKHAKHPLDFAAEIGITKNPVLIAI